jgi:hypothetical protein
MRLGFFFLLVSLAFGAQEEAPAEKAPAKKAVAKKPVAKKSVAKKPVVKKAAVANKAAVAKTAAVAKKVDVNCVDVPRVRARRAPVKKLELSEVMSKELAGVLLGVSLNQSLDLNLDMEAPNEKSAEQLEKLVGVLTAAERLKAKPGELVSIDLSKAARVSKSGNVVRTTVSLTDAQLEKLLEARYGKRLVSQAKAMMAIYVHGLPSGMRTIPFEN